MFQETVKRSVCERQSNSPHNNFSSEATSQLKMFVRLLGMFRGKRDFIIYNYDFSQTKQLYT